jgi:ureidoglycolate lyase
MIPRAQPLTEEGFQPFGTVLTHPSQAGRTAILPVLRDERGSTPVTATLIRYDASPERVAFSTIERHPVSEQLFLNFGGHLLIAVAPSTANGAPDLAGLAVFVSEVDQSFGYHPGVWHAPLCAVKGPATVASILRRDGGDQDVEVVTLPHPIEVLSA